MGVLKVFCNSEEDHDVRCLVAYIIQCFSSVRLYFFFSFYLLDKHKAAHSLFFSKNDPKVLPLLLRHHHKIQCNNHHPEQPSLTLKPQWWLHHAMDRILFLVGTVGGSE